MMVQGTSGLVPNSGDVASSAEAHKSGGGGFSEDEKLRISEEGERNSGGNRWPRQETMALLKIRSDMDVAFRDSGLKGPLWEEVSRKLAELGYHRSAKKCKEKFENVYKYHKRTKDGRTTKADGKTYRFFDQLEAFDTHPSFQLPPPVIPQPLTSAPPPTVMAMSVSTNTMPIVPQLTIPSTENPNKNPTNISPHEPPQPQPQPQPQSQPQPQPMIVKTSSIPTQSISPPFHQSKMSTSFVSNSNSSSSTSSDEEPERSRKRKRVWKDFFGRLMKEVIEKQEELQKNFLEALEKRERDRMMREEAWRVQEMAKMNREHEILVQERSMSAAKDAAVIAFLQKVTEQQTQQNLNATSQIVQVQDTQLQLPPPQPPASSPQLQQQPQPQPQPQPRPQPQPQSQQHQPVPPPPQVPLSLPPPPQLQTQVPQPQIKDNNGCENFMSPSPSRWPKAEIEALIRLRTTLDTKYQENAPKGPLWEEISAAMRNLGYNRNAKRCKEKWENINKYYKKVKESNKKRPEDAKTCPYFHQLEAIYKEKAKTSINHGNGGASGDSFNPGFAMKTENPMGPIMVRPEQQWPHDQNDEEEDTGEDDEEDDDGADGYEIVTNKALTDE